MNPKTRKGLSTLLIWVLMGALILYMISGGFTTKTPDEITLQDFVKLVEDKKVQAVHETLGSGLYTGLYTGSNYTIKDLPNRADFTFTCSEEEFSKNMSLLIAKMQGKDADAVSSVDYPFTYTVVQPKGQSWLVVILPYVLLFGSMALFMWFMYRQQGGGKQMANFGRSRAREYAPGQNPITFKDVAGSPRWAPGYPRASCWWARRGPARPSWPRPWRGRPRCPSSPSPAPISWRCSWAWARPAFGTCSTQPKGAPPR